MTAPRAQAGARGIKGRPLRWKTDGRGARTSGGFGNLAGVRAERVEGELVIGHGYRLDCLNAGFFTALRAFTRYSRWR